MKKMLTDESVPVSVQAVSSKSFLHRALVCAALCEGQTDILCTPPGEDVLATAACLRKLGAQIAETADGFTVRGGLRTKKAPLDCKQSGTTLRFLLPLAAALGVCADFSCDAQLRRRPMEPLVTQLRAHGCRIRTTETGWHCEGQLSGGAFSLPGDVSSQFLSGLLLALPLLVDDSKVMLTSKLASAPYVQLTQSVQAQFGVASVPMLAESDRSDHTAQASGSEIKNSELFSVSGNRRYQSPQTVIAEGDWTNAAPFLCAGAFSGSGVTVTGLSPASVQGDRAIVPLLRQFGAEVCCDGDAVTVRRGTLHGCRINAADIPDLVPLLALLGACAEGETVICNAARLRGKETDRLQTTAQTLNALGADVTVTQDGLDIRGVRALHGGTVSACGDHRIAMLAAAASLACTAPVTIDGAEAVSKSYPGFFTDFEKIRR